MLPGHWHARLVWYVLSVPHQGGMIRAQHAQRSVLLMDEEETAFTKPISHVKQR